MARKKLSTARNLPATLASLAIPILLLLFSLASPAVAADGSWNQMSGMSNWLEDVWGSSGSYVFAVGFSGTVLHYSSAR